MYIVVVGARSTPKVRVCHIVAGAYAQEIVEGLEGTHKGGTRYPITVAMRDTVTMPKSYQELMKMLSGREAPATGKRD